MKKKTSKFDQQYDVPEEIRNYNGHERWLVISHNLYTKQQAKELFEKDLEKPVDSDAIKIWYARYRLIGEEDVCDDYDMIGTRSWWFEENPFNTRGCAKAWCYEIPEEVL